MGEKADWQKELDLFIEKGEKVRRKKERNDKLITSAFLLVGIFQLLYFTDRGAWLSLTAIVWIVVMLSRDFLLARKERKIAEEIAKTTRLPNEEEA